jgi:hypothetical protein
MERPDLSDMRASVLLERGAGPPHVSGVDREGKGTRAGVSQALVRNSSGVGQDSFRSRSIPACRGP